jgi:hypothetical protein
VTDARFDLMRVSRGGGLKGMRLQVSTDEHR